MGGCQCKKEIKEIVKKKQQNPAKIKPFAVFLKKKVYQTYITSIHAYLQSEVDKVNKQIEANKESSEGQDSEHTKQIEKLRNILNESTDSFNKKLDDARSDLSDTIQEKTDAIRLDIDEVCDKDEEMNETVSGTPYLKHINNNNL